MYGLSTHTRGFIKIQDGCENFCAYCAIPYARGPIKSRKPSDVIDEIKTLASKGVKEIILSGINTGTYGQDLNEDVTLASLLDDILSSVNGCFRLRLSSIELMEITDELLDVYEKYPTQIARHFHIPLQAGCDNTLKRMKRKYLTSDYERVINKIRSRFPGIAITTDCLAGFVGETDNDFEDALEFIEKINFSSMHIFPYSRRKNTEADKMDGHLPGELIHARAKKMQELAQKMAKNYQEEHIGKEMVVLVEQKKNNYWIGHTSNYLEVKFVSKEELTNKLVLVKLNKVDNNTIIAEFIKEVENEF
jgi:threonylcarbamoyladenosine tRNA methylthiotransferase MtaB